MKLAHSLFLLGVIMSTTASNAAVTYQQAERRVEAQQPDGSDSKSTVALGSWVESVTFGSPGLGVGSSQTSTLSETAIDFVGACTGDVFTSSSATLFARVRLTEQTLITFNGSFVRFGVPGGSEISASIVGGDYNFSFAALDDQSPNGSFGASDVLLQPGDYDINLLSRSINFEVPALTFNLTFTTVPAPGAAGLAMAGLGAAGLRRSRRED